MKKLIVILAALLAPVLAVKAQEQERAQEQDIPRHEFQIESYWGVSTLQYKALEATSDPGFGGGGGLLYTWHLNRWWGLTTGLEATFRQSSLQYPDDSGILSGKWDASGQLSVSYHLGLSEKQKYTQLLVPLMVQFAPPPGDNGHQLYLAAGGKFGFRLAGSYSQTARTVHLTQKAVVPEYDFTLPWSEESQGLEDPYIFYQQVGSLSPAGDMLNGDSYSAGGRFGKLFDIIAAVELGVRWRLSSANALYTGLFLDAGLVSQADGGAALVLPDGSSSSVLSSCAAPVPSVKVSDCNGSKRIEATVPSACDNLTSRPRTLGFGLKVRFAFGRGSVSN